MNDELAEYIKQSNIGRKVIFYVPCMTNSYRGLFFLGWATSFGLVNCYEVHWLDKL